MITDFDKALALNPELYDLRACPCLAFREDNTQCRQIAGYIGTARDRLQRFLCEEHKDLDPVSEPISEFWRKIDEQIEAEQLEAVKLSLEKE